MADLAVDPRMELNPPLIRGEATYTAVTDRISQITERKPPRQWYYAMGVAIPLLLLLVVCLVYLVTTGIGVWGNNSPVGWGWDITNFVWWIGIGHAGTLISAILFLFRQKWRTSINRAAEAMTLFAVACAGIYPLFHTGRPWRAAYWLFPMPNEALNMWQNFRSPLMWDVFAVSTYATGLGAVLVCRPHPRPRHPARPFAGPQAQDAVRPAQPGLARLGHAVAAL